MNNFNQINAAQGPQLHDIVLPIEPSYWPLAIGWWLVIAISLIALIFTTTTVIKHLKYWKVKRLAQGKLADCTSCDEINQLLKQVAIHYCTRQDIGPMKNAQWTNFLMSNLAESQRETLNDIHQALYRPNHDEYRNNYLHIANTWLTQLNKNSLREMNNVVI